MEFADRIQRVKPSATLTINAKAAELKSQGSEIISLAVGEPDFSPPQHVLDAAAEAIKQGANRYTPVPGTPDLLQSLADYVSRSYGFPADKDMAIVTNGGKQGLFNLFQILLQQGDEVLIPGPYWVSYPDMVLLADGDPVIVPTEPESNFLTDPEQLQRYCSEKTKALILNSPSNPTGCHYSQEKLDNIIKWALDNGLFIISDEIYDHLVYPPAETASAIKWLKEASEQIAIVNGLSKCFALTGWRIGHVLSHPQIIKNLSKIQGQSTSNVCSVVQRAAKAAFDGNWDFLEPVRKSLARRRDKALDIIASWKGVDCPKPDGAFYLFPRMESFYTSSVQDSTQMCTYLLEKAEVALVPGSAFGDDRCVRFSYAVEENTLVQALDKVQKALQEL